MTDYASSAPLIVFLRACLDDDERYASHGGPTNSWAPRLIAEVESKRRILDMWEDPAFGSTLPEGVHDERHRSR